MASTSDLREALNRAAAAGDEAAALDLAARITALEKQAGTKVAEHKAPPAGQFDDITMRDLTRSYAQGGSFGGQDEIQAALGAGLDKLSGVPYLPNYRSLRDIERTDQAQFADAHPGIDFAAQMAGGISLPGLGGAQTAAKTGRALSAVGAVEGGLAGLGYSTADTVGGTAADVALGTGTGAFFGWATPKVINAGRNLVTGMGRMAGDMASDEGEAAARRAIERAMTRDGLTLDQSMARMRKMGPESMLADTGPNMRALARETTAQPGPALTTAARNLDARTNARPDRLTGHLEETAQRSVDDFTETMKLTSKIRSEEGAKLYQQAFDEGFEPTDELVRMSKLPIIQDALRKARGRMDKFDEPVGGTLKILQEAKEVLWDQAEAAKRKGQGKLANRIDKARRDMVDEMDNSSPTYKQARNLWAGTKEVDDAAQYGRSLLTGKKFPDEVAADISKMTDTEIEAFQMGAVRGVFDFLEESGDIGRVRQLIRKPRFQKLLGNIFPDNAAKEKFFEKMLVEQQFQATSNRVLGGSDTARILAGMQENKFITGAAGAATESAITGGLPWGSVLSTISKRLSPNISDETVEVIGKALFGDMSEKQLERLLRRSGATRISPKPGALSNIVGTAAAPVGAGALTEAMQ